tara:strand:+ start:454 stop:894 length:441 start_codon:yes stop_codon:yes gene_type:complete
MKKILLIGGLLAIMVLLIGCQGNNVTGDAVAGGTIEIPLNQITETLQKYEFDADGTKVRYLVGLGTDGKVRTAFDACDVCGGSQGYSQKGTDVVCNKCGKVFRIDDLGTRNTQGGGCWPSYLKHDVNGDSVFISMNELKAGAFRFK